MNHETSRRRSKPGLSPDMIVRSALSIIEDQGLAALSARRLAATLNCEAMSLYHHFPNMEAVLDGVVDVLLAGQRITGTDPQSAEAALIEAAIGYLGIADRTPHAFQLVATRRWHTPNALRAVQSMVGAFATLGFPADQSLGKSRILASYLNGAGLALAAWRKSDGQPLGDVSVALQDVGTESLRAHSVRTDLENGVALIVRTLTSDSPGADHSPRRL